MRTQDQSTISALAAVEQLLEHLEDLPDRGRELLGIVRHDLERAGVELHEATARYRALVETIPAIVYVDIADDSMVTTYVSPQIEALLGVTPDEYMADPDLWERHLHPDDREAALEAYRAGRDAGGGFTFEYRLLSRDGNPVWFRDSAVVIPGTDGRPPLIQGVMLDITDRKAAEEQAAFLAYHDKATGLPNKAMFEELLGLAIARARRHDLAVAVISMDLDDFKLVNDSLGHEAGDDLLRQLSDRLGEATRETDLVARQGGDEFLLLLSDLDRGTQPSVVPGSDQSILIAESVANRVQDVFVEPFMVGGTEVYLSGSIGIAAFPAHAADATDLVKNADAAMYQSKRVSPGGYAVFADDTTDALGKLSLSTRLRKAVENQHWELHYQPIVEVVDGRMLGVEALIRWNDPSGGLVPPGEFIPLAEEMGLIEVIGDWVVEELARQDVEWRAQGLELELSFNLSPRQLWQKDIASRILDRLAEGNVDPSRVVVEVTESTAMTDPDRTLRILGDLNASGLRIAIDDFGTGYSSLSRLKHMPVDILKIDRSFVRDAHTDGASGSMVKAIIQLANGLGMTSLAEGVETEGERRFLVEHGCRLAQGFHFARPALAADILAGHRRAALKAV